MTEQLLPTRHVVELKEGLTDYLATTFSLSDTSANAALTEFLTGEATSIFKGPFVRTRLPFKAANSKLDLSWDTPYNPYLHQVQAYQRLSTVTAMGGQKDPEPTLVATGTGSGKTESFLYPILQHAKDNPNPGIKAIILYPMNALANDQASRLAQLIAGTDALRGIRAALYTGEGGSRTVVEKEGLITDRKTIQLNPPDILLTNYKMLDHLLLRAEDQGLWRTSATSLRYIVLDEFHTYDGAQGTDVALLLRRLGLTIKSYWPQDFSSEPQWEDSPLGMITPVATSATLGDGGNTQPIRQFAHTVFGVPFEPESIIGETRLEYTEWANELGKPKSQIKARDLVSDYELINSELANISDPIELATAVMNSLYEPDVKQDTEITAFTAHDVHTKSFGLLAALAQHPLVKKVITHSQSPIALSELAENVLQGVKKSVREEYVSNVFAMLSCLRRVYGITMPSVETHLWVRALNRIDREASSEPAYRWGDDANTTENEESIWLPAIYCRHCGRSGWMVSFSQTGERLAAEGQDNVRQDHSVKGSRTRALIHAPVEGRKYLDGDTHSHPGLRWFDSYSGSFREDTVTRNDEGFDSGTLLPVLFHTEQATQDSSKSDEYSAQDTCPSCMKRAGIRYVGSALPTMLSVTVSGLFGMHNVEDREKKTLIFTDSVQDAAHRAGFIEARSHTITLRTILRHALHDDSLSLQALVDRLIDMASDDPSARYQIVNPTIAFLPKIVDYWRGAEGTGRLNKKLAAKAEKNVRNRALFDACLEVGINTKFGRTLEQSGSISVETTHPDGASITDDDLFAIAQEALSLGNDQVEQQPLGEQDTFQADHRQLLIAWVRGTLVRMRVQGAIYHPWLENYIHNDCRRYYVWGGRPKEAGMPAFPMGRSAPRFPRIGQAPSQGAKYSEYDDIASDKGWYSQWTARCLKRSGAESRFITKALFDQLSAAHILTSHTTSTGRLFSIPASSIQLSPTSLEDLESGKALLVCDTCSEPAFGSLRVHTQLLGAPCFNTRCNGAFISQAHHENFYRSRYNTALPQRISAREHSSVLEAETRITYENEFKSYPDPVTAPNVLVATPTLEMGIDIGDLSTVILASIPRTIASYVQRVGRAGRATGSSLNLVFSSSRGTELAKVRDPLATINGSVRPPATYLGAEEILRRQYLAFVGSVLASKPGFRTPRSPREAFGSYQNSSGSYVHDLINLNEERHAELLESFVGAVAADAGAGAAALRAWATPGENTVSDLASYVGSCVMSRQKRLDDLRYHYQQIFERLDSLRQKYQATKEEADKQALQAATHAKRAHEKLLREVDNEYWLAELEKEGLFPNYTLLDDSVDLNVTMSYLDSQQEYQSDEFVHTRPSRVALRDFAPGATYYANHQKILIDTLDVGPEAENIRHMALCPNCGFGDFLDVTGLKNVSKCRQCGDEKISDNGQNFPVVELKRVRAQVRRDDALINDQDDERNTEVFSILATAFLDPAELASQWYVHSSAMGVKYSTSAVIRWLNGGSSKGSTSTALIAGEELPGGRFRVCKLCGRQDRVVGENHQDHHHPWCPQRDEHAEASVEVLLSRTLHTEALVLRLPPLLTRRDGFMLPSLIATMKLALREHFGGEATHVAMELINDPDYGGRDDSAGETTTSLLIHDTVPGGTGYLAQLARPDVLWSILAEALQFLRNCPCGETSENCCHRCLLSFAGRREAGKVVRSRGEHALEHLLGLSSGQDIPDQLSWEIDQRDTSKKTTESHVEQMFRELFKKQCEQHSYRVREETRTIGGLSITDTRHDRRWVLEPQVQLGYTTPDFVLRSSDSNVPPTAIYVDGARWHAHPSSNRIADDASKRTRLRDEGYMVLSVSAVDLQSASEKLDPTIRTMQSPPRLVREDTLKNPLVLKTSTRADRDLIQAGPLDVLMAWMNEYNASSSKYHKPGHSLMWALVAQSLHNASPPVDLVDTANAFGASTVLGLAHSIAEEPNRALTAEPQIPGVSVIRSGYLTILITLSSMDKLPTITLVLDDSEDAVADEHFATSWRHWLHLSNLLGWARCRHVGRMRDIHITATSLHDIDSADPADIGSLTPAGETEQPQLDPDYAEAMELAAEGVEQQLLTVLASLKVAAPEVGEEVEIGSGASTRLIPLTLSWMDEKIAITTPLHDEAMIDSLRAEGWSLHIVDDTNPDAACQQVAAELGR